MINTNLGKIAVFPILVDSDRTPIIFLQGVYFDHQMWDEVIDSIHDRTTYSVDMSFHGLSKEITKNDWSLNDCAEMLLEILDSLKITKVIAVGHSWGSMTILRAASKQPERFEGVLLCNMPFLAATKKTKDNVRPSAFNVDVPKFLHETSRQSAIWEDFTERNSISSK